MQAQVIEQFGEPSIFKSVELPKPEAIAGHLVIEVKATSVNPVDVKIREGAVASIAPDFPAVLHGDVAGIVVEVGEGVDKFKVGDEVYGCAGGVKGTGGALAEFMLADANLMAHKPKSLTMAEAAALPLVTITAWEGLISRANVQPGQKVLVYGSTGGVGHIVVQLAKAKGATVYALISSDKKAAIAKELGADFTINYREKSVAEFVAEHTDGAGFDIVFDTVGDDNLQNSFQAAKLNGTVSALVSLSTQDLSTVHLKGLTLNLVFMLIPMLFNVNRADHGQILAEAAELVDQGQLKPLIDAQSFAFTEVAAAHTHAASGKAIGKVVLTQSAQA